MKFLEEKFQKNFRKCDLTEIRRINLLLNENKWSGLADLLVLMQKCDENLLLAEGSKWFKLCSQIFSKKVNPDFLISAALVLRYLLKCCHKHSKLKIEISKLSSDFLADICKDALSITIEVFELMYSYLKLFSHQSIQHRGIIEKIVLSFLTVDGYGDTKLCSKIAVAARVYSVLPSSGPYLSENRIKAKSAQLMQIISLSHQSMDTLFKVVAESESYDIDRNCNLKISNEKIDQNMDPLFCYISSLTMFYNSLIFVQEFLSHVDSDLNILLNIRSILMRPLQVFAKEKKNQVEYQIFSTFLPTIHQMVLVAMKNMLLKNQELLASTNQFMMERLIYFLSYENHSYPLSSTTKELAYDVLATLCTVSNGSQILPITLCNCIIRDLIQSKKKIILNTNSSNNQTQATIPVECKVEYDGNVVTSALNLVTDIYLCNFCNISNLFAQKINKCLMELFLNLNEGPYLEPKIRGVFYRTLKANVCAPQKTVSISYSRILNILQLREKEEDVETGRIINDIRASICFKHNAELYQKASVEDNTTTNADNELTFVDEEMDAVSSSMFKNEEEVEAISPSKSIIGGIPEDNIDRSDAEPIMSSRQEVEEDTASVEEMEFSVNQESEHDTSSDTSDEENEVEIAEVDESQPVSEEVSKMMDLFVPTFN